MNSAVVPPAWLRVLQELQGTNPVDFDGVRRRKLTALSRHTGRPVVVHASACTVPNKVLPPQFVMMDFADIKAFETATAQLPPGPLDIVLHTPGGLPEAVEGIIRVLRPKFGPVRFIVPSIAKSAGTMLAMSGDEVLLHANGELGPTDPQMVVGSMVASADDILEQFERARDELVGNPARGMKGDPNRVAVWGPILATMGPALLLQCQNAKALTQRIVTDALTQHMFAGDPMGAAKAQGIAAALNSHSRWLSHGRNIGLDELQRLGVKASGLSVQTPLLELVDELWASVDLTLGNTPAFRLTENNLGHAAIRLAGQAPMMAIQIGPQPGQAPRSLPPPSTQPHPGTS